MTVQEYNQKVLENINFGEGQNIIYPVLALNGEAGEVAEKVKKVLRDKGGVFDEEAKHDIALELGDSLFYITAAAENIGYTLEEIMRMNIVKIESRRIRGVTGGSGDRR